MVKRDREFLEQQLRRIDGKGYGAYKDLRGRYDLESGWTLCVDHVQGDPFAAPSRLSLLVQPQHAEFDPSLYANEPRRVALADFLARRFAALCQRAPRGAGSGKSGLFFIDTPGQEVLTRTASQVSVEGALELRFTLGLPAAGRRVLGRSALKLLLEELPSLLERTLYACRCEAAELRRHVEAVEDARALRAQLADAGLVAFVVDGAILPRASGVNACPMPLEAAIPFESPAELHVSFSLPNAGEVWGMGIPRGVTLIVGGGYHGKSTLLDALELGVYDHLPGDGREGVVAEERAVKIRAEDGRRIAGVDISPFIDNLPQGRGEHAPSTRQFCTEDASGSTSQAANAMEALEAGATTLLLDEDTAATNFMIRDARMQRLVVKAKEPITPFIDRVRQLYEQHGVSTVLVMGGSGDYFEVADRVIAMEDYRPRDVTAEAHAIAAEGVSSRDREGSNTFVLPQARVPLPESLDPSKGRHEARISGRGLRTIHFGQHEIDLTALDQLVAPSQLDAIGRAIYLAREEAMDGRRTIGEVLDWLEQQIAALGLDILDGRRMGDMSAFRRFELAAALNRLRTLRVV
ncbi:MAG: ABC-ATPase domain-containing protein [Deltaproteobacteria bacterium]|nr:ABC-ATPase domain-containing protein [Deltaproteobacteria bacterium]